MMRDGKPEYEPNGFVQKVCFTVGLAVARVVHMTIDIMRHRHREDESGRRYYPWDEGW